MVDSHAVEPIVDDETHARLMAECEALCIQDPPLGTEQAARLMVLALAIETYEKVRWPIIPPLDSPRGAT